MQHTKYTINQMQDVAKDRKGRCLSKEYKHARYPLTWQCRKGHTWDMYPEIIMRGAWCPSCIKDKYFEEACEVAESKGGKCLSAEYINGYTNLLWRCQLGHEWSARPNNIKNGTWCPTCNKVTIQDMQELAEKRGGKCLSKKYIGSHTHLKWQCNEGHIWKAVPSAIKQGEWCRICGIKGSADKQRDTIEHMVLIAISRGGNCLSTTYVHGKMKLNWECKLGHKWSAVADHIKQGTWCPVCAREKSNKYLELGRKPRVKV